MKRTDTVQCVLVWIEDVQVWDGETYASDLGERPGLRAVQKARAAMWMNAAAPGDVDRARAYASKEGAQVFTFLAESNPLEAAKKAALGTPTTPPVA